MEESDSDGVDVSIDECRCSPNVNDCRRAMVSLEDSVPEDDKDRRNGRRAKGGKGSSALAVVCVEVLLLALLLFVVVASNGARFISSG